MAEYTYDQLKNMTVVQLREMVPTLPNQEALEGYSTMHKDHLLPLMCKVLGIHIHHAAVGSEKARMKAAVRRLKVKRDEMTAADKGDQLPAIRQQLHVLKRKLRRLADKADKQPAAAPATPPAPGA
jgi:hypothetical protein